MSITDIKNVPTEMDFAYNPGVNGVYWQFKSWSMVCTGSSNTGQWCVLAVQILVNGV
jgi:hypothetical protein